MQNGISASDDGQKHSNLCSTRNTQWSFQCSCRCLSLYLSDALKAVMFKGENIAEVREEEWEEFPGAGGICQVEQRQCAVRGRTNFRG